MLCLSLLFWFKTSVVTSVFHLPTDVVGVCKSAADVQELTARSTGKLLKKRELTLVDNSGGAVSNIHNGPNLLESSREEIILLN